jgi:hypothetical protein
MGSKQLDVDGFLYGIECSIEMPKSAGLESRQTDDSQHIKNALDLTFDFHCCNFKF